jgi:hypothetical protein
LVRDMQDYLKELEKEVLGKVEKLEEIGCIRKGVITLIPESSAADATSGKDTK